MEKESEAVIKKSRWYRLERPITSILLILAWLALTVIVTYTNTFKYTQHITKMEWIAKCEEARAEERANRLDIKESDFQEALSSSIMKMQPKLDNILASRIATEIIDKCKDNKLDPILITALIWVESRFDPLAHSNKGAVGLMQIRYTTWKGTPALHDNGVSAKYKLYHIDLNIKCGTDIFAKYYKEAEYNIVKTLYRYNSGSKNIPEDKEFHEIGYANKIIITACNIRESIRNAKEI